MTPDFIHDALKNLRTRASAAGLKVITTLLDRVFGERPPEEHAKWDKETRQPAQNHIAEALAVGIHNPPDKPEVLTSELLSLRELPPLEGGSFADAAESTEVKALESAGAIVRDGKHLLVLDPQRLLSGLVRLLDDKSLWLAVEAQIQSHDLYDSVVAPIRMQLGRVTSYDAMLQLYCHASKLYGVRIRSVSAEQIYSGAPVFIEKARSLTALTNSRTSGLLDPLERYGTEELLRILRIDTSHRLFAQLRSKEPWRIHNFRYGLLNPTSDAKRPYFFDRGATSEAMRSTLDVLPDDAARGRYKDLAAKSLVEAVNCPGMEILEVPHFELWMTRYTRSAPGHALISLRHPDTRAIDRGIELNFGNYERLRWFYSLVFKMASPLAAYVYGSVYGLSPLALPVILAGLAGFEEGVYRGVDRRLFRKAAEEEMRKCAKRVRLTGDDDEERAASARSYLESLICAS